MYRPKGQVKLLRISLASLVACVALAAPAYAETGNGLYEPFPSPTSETLAQEFVAGLPGGVTFTDLGGLDLQRGVLVGRAARAAYASATPVQRASGDARFTPSLGWPLALALLIAALAGAGFVAVRRS